MPLVIKPELSFAIALSALLNQRGMYINVQIIHLISLPGYKDKRIS
jgi:hypothetical protein